MPSINMIAARRAEKNRAEQRTKNLVYGILAEAGLFAVAISYMVLQLVSTQGQVASLNDRIAKLKPQVDQINALQAQTAQLEPKVTALDSARTNTLYWYTAVQNLSYSLAGTSWLVNLSTAGDPATAVSAASTPANASGGAEMVVSGISMSQSDVGQLMLRMNQYPQFSHIDLNYVQQTQLPGVIMPKATDVPVQFQMAVQLQSTAPPAKSTGDANVQKS